MLIFVDNAAEIVGQSMASQGFGVKPNPKLALQMKITS